MQLVNRRRFERFALLPAYTPVSVRLVADDSYEFEGHAYDISEAGIRFELDRPIEPGTPVLIAVTLPGPGPQLDRQVRVLATVVWVDDDADEPGPVRMAASFSRFASTANKTRLLEQMGTGRYARAA